MRGNVLFLVLIAAALFAALSYAVTQSGRGSGSIDKETAALETAKFLQQVTLIGSTVDRMILTGCAKTQITYEGATTSNPPGYVNGSSPSDNSCHVYEPEGGGLTYSSPPSTVMDGINPERRIMGSLYLPAP
ncbi:MAG: hypothetical protein OXT65_00485 [Alphaproteobacteria bacterium]|nr:hypothetical protein [Alphaproteobacteria bacterium]